MKLMNFGIVIPLLSGLISGWAINYLADTLPTTRRLSAPVCAQCGEPYSLARYLVFGACESCGQRRSLRPWMVQIAMLAVSVYTWFQPHAMGYALGLVLLTYFGVVIVIDLEHRLILHPTSIVGAVLAAGIGLWLHGIVQTVLGGLEGFAIMLALYYLGVLFSKYRARKLQAAGQEADDEEALGAGDVILAGILGLLLGPLLTWFTLLLGILFGGIVGIVLLIGTMVRGRYGQQALMIFMPYGPCFVLSAFFIMFLPNWITPLLK